MNRIQFLKSLITVAAAPKLLTEVSTIPKCEYSVKELFLSCNKDLLREMQHTQSALIKHNMKQNGFDPDKPFKIDIGYDNEDFCNNTFTVRIIQ